MADRAKTRKPPMPLVQSHRARLLGDGGGTNTRFAWQAEFGAPVEHLRTLRSADHASLEAALLHYLRQIDKPIPREASIAMANPVLGDWVRMTNHTWAFSIAAMKASLGLDKLLILNDFKAIALSLTALGPDDVRQVGEGSPRADGARGVIGPGTGLGVSGLLPDGHGGWIPIDGEGGHVTLPARTAREQLVVEWLGRRHGHASAERAISGAGLVDIYRALRDIDGADDARPAAQPTPCASGDLAADQITATALADGDTTAIEAVALMCAFLGTVAGDLALTLGATGGIYIGGGIVPRLGDFFDRSPFRAHFEAKGRFSSYVAAIPTFVIVRASSPALLGAQRALDADGAGNG